MGKTKRRRTPDYKKIGAAVKHYRTLAGATQAELAKLTGDPTRRISGIEAGEPCSIDLLFELVTILGIPGDEIFRPAAPLDAWKAKRAMASNMLLRCTEPQLNIALSALLSTLENFVPGDIDAVAAATYDPALTNS